MAVAGDEQAPIKAKVRAKTHTISAQSCATQTPRPELKPLLLGQRPLASSIPASYSFLAVYRRVCTAVRVVAIFLHKKKGKLKFSKVNGDQNKIKVIKKNNCTGSRKGKKKSYPMSRTWSGYMCRCTHLSINAIHAPKRPEERRVFTSADLWGIISWEAGGGDVVDEGDEGDDQDDNDAAVCRP